MNKTKSRQRRAYKARARSRELNKVRLSVHRTLQHTYAQLIDVEGKVLASASTLVKDIKANVKHGANMDAAKLVGSAIAAAGAKAGVKKVAFDRSGFKYHGRLKALADAAREGGLEF